MAVASASMPELPGTTLRDYVALYAFGQIHGLGALCGYYHMSPETWQSLEHHWSVRISTPEQQSEFWGLVQAEVSRLQGGGRPLEIAADQPPAQSGQPSSPSGDSMQGDLANNPAATLVMEDLPPQMLADLQRMYEANVASGPGSDVAPPAEPLPSTKPLEKTRPPSVGPTRMSRPMSLLSLVAGIAASCLALSLGYDLFQRGGAAATAGLSLDALLADGRAVGSVVSGLLAALLAWQPLRKRLWISAIGLSFGLLGAILTLALYVE